MAERSTIVDGKGSRHEGTVVSREQAAPETLLEALIGPVAALCTGGFGGRGEQKATVRDDDGRLWTGKEQ